MDDREDGVAPARGAGVEGPLDGLDEAVKVREERVDLLHDAGRRGVGPLRRDLQDVPLHGEGGRGESWGPLTGTPLLLPARAHLDAGRLDDSEDGVGHEREARDDERDACEAEGRADRRDERV